MDIVDNLLLTSRQILSGPLLPGQFGGQRDVVLEKVMAAFVQEGREVGIFQQRDGVAGRGETATRRGLFPVELLERLVYNDIGGVGKASCVILVIRVGSPSSCRLRLLLPFS